MIIGHVQNYSKKASSAKKTNESIIANGSSKEKISKINLTQEDDLNISSNNGEARQQPKDVKS